MKTIINDLYFLKKTVIVHRNAQKKKLLLFANKLIEKVLDPHNAKQHH